VSSNNLFYVISFRTDILLPGTKVQYIILSHSNRMITILRSSAFAFPKGVQVQWGVRAAARWGFRR